MEKPIKTPSRKWMVRVNYTDELGVHRRKKFTADTKKEAVNKASMFEMELKHDNTPYNVTLTQFIRY